MILNYPLSLWVWAWKECKTVLLCFVPQNGQWAWGSHNEHVRRGSLASNSVTAGDTCDLWLPLPGQLGDSLPMADFLNSFIKVVISGTHSGPPFQWDYEFFVSLENCQRTQKWRRSRHIRFPLSLLENRYSPISFSHLQWKRPDSLIFNLLSITY